MGATLPLVGIGIQLADPTSSDALADSSDFLWFDQEHTPLSPEMLKWHIMVAHGKGCPVIVRVPGPNLVAGEGRPWGTWIKHAIDSNADGIVVPQVRTAEDVKSVVADCRYPTGGNRPSPYDAAQTACPDDPARLRRGFGPTTPMNYVNSTMRKPELNPRPLPCSSPKRLVRLQAAEGCAFKSCPCRGEYP